MPILQGYFVWSIHYNIRNILGIFCLFNCKYGWISFQKITFGFFFFLTASNMMSVLTSTLPLPRVIIYFATSAPIIPLLTFFLLDNYLALFFTFMNFAIYCYSCVATIFIHSIPSQPMLALFISGGMQIVMSVAILRVILLFLSFFLPFFSFLYIGSFTKQKKNNFQIFTFEAGLDTDILVKILEVSEEKSKAKTIFISRMSHELRTPLHGLLSSASLIRQTPITEEQETYLSAIDSCGKMLLDIITKILDITRIESGKFETEKVRFNLYDVIENVVESISSLADKKFLDLLVKFELSGDGYDVEGDNSHFRQIITNVFILFYFIS